MVIPYIILDFTPLNPYQQNITKRCFLRRFANISKGPVILVHNQYANNTKNTSLAKAGMLMNFEAFDRKMPLKIT